MNTTRCPHCGGRLGRFLYADACPHCHHELAHNTRILVSAPVVTPHAHTSWPYRLARGVIKLIES